MELNKNEWVVRHTTKSDAEKLIREYHYSHSFSKARVAIHGLYKIDDIWGMCYGVAWWLPIASPTAAKFFSDDWENVLSLSRFVIVPNAPKNAASFLLSRSIKMLPERWHTLATYADTYQNHTGIIYRATNWEYMGITDPCPIYKNNGSMVSIRTGNKTKNKQEMIAEGCELIGYYAKHRFCYRRKITHKTKPTQLSLFQMTG